LIFNTVSFQIMTKEWIIYLLPRIIIWYLPIIRLN
jgi:hypothetical protein